MSYLLENIDISNYGIIPGHSPGSNISLQGCFDMPERTGECFHEWGDESGVEPFVLADEIFFSGRDIAFYGSIIGTISELNSNLNSFYSAINATSGLVVLTTPYCNATGFVKSVIPEYMNGGCSLVMIFREPVVDMIGAIPASGVSNYTIDSVPFASFGLYLSKAKALHDLPDLKEQFFTKYGSESYQIVKRKNNTLEFDGFIVADSLFDFKSKVRSLYKIFSSAGTRTMNLNGTTVVCFATSGFTIDNIFFYNMGLIARFKMSLIVVSVA